MVALSEKVAVWKYVDKVIGSAMKYRTQVAFVDGLMKELGLPLENIGMQVECHSETFLWQMPEMIRRKGRLIAKLIEDSCNANSN